MIHTRTPQEKVTLESTWCRAMDQFVAKSSQYPNGDPSGWYPDTLWPHLIKGYHPGTMLDLGCGQGQVVDWFQGQGIDSHGVDFSESAIQGNSRLIQHDISTGPIGLNSDLVWSCEFVEHIEEEHVDNLISAIDSATGSVLAMTHAVVGQGGTHHVNCRPMRYWIEKIQGSTDLRFDSVATWTARRVAKFGYFARSGLIFVRGNNA